MKPLTVTPPDPCATIWRCAGWVGTAAWWPDTKYLDSITVNPCVRTEEFAHKPGRSLDMLRYDGNLNAAFPIQPEPRKGMIWSAA